MEVHHECEREQIPAGLFNVLRQDEIVNVPCGMSLSPYEMHAKKQHSDSVVIHFTYILYFKLKLTWQYFLLTEIFGNLVVRRDDEQGAHYHINVFWALLLHLEDVSATGSGAVCFADPSGFSLTFVNSRGFSRKAQASL